MKYYVLNRDGEKSTDFFNWSCRSFDDFKKAIEEFRHLKKLDVEKHMNGADVSAEPNFALSISDQTFKEYIYLLAGNYANNSLFTGYLYQNAKNQKIAEILDTLYDELGIGMIRFYDAGTDRIVEEPFEKYGRKILIPDSDCQKALIERRRWYLSK